MAGDIADQGPVWSLTDAVVELASGSTVVDVDLFWVRSVTPTPDVTTLTFEGDDGSDQIDEINRVNVQAICDKQDFDAIQRIFGKTRVTGQAGEEWRMYMGDDAETAGVSCGLRYTLKYRDDSQTPPVAGEVAYRYPLGTVKVVQPQAAEWKAKNVMQLNFTFNKTTTDVAGQALAEVPTNGAVYLVSKLS